MTTTPPRVGADDRERQVIHNIRDFGWHCVNVIEDDGHPPWTYTIGFHDTWNHPEMILIGRSRATAHHTWNCGARDRRTIWNCDFQGQVPRQSGRWSAPK